MNDHATGRGEIEYSGGSKYIGQFFENLRHGEGTIIYPDGKKYIGGFNKNSRHGEGQNFHPNGELEYKGEFR